MFCHIKNTGKALLYVWWSSYLKNTEPDHAISILVKGLECP